MCGPILNIYLLLYSEMNRRSTYDEIYHHLASNLLPHWHTDILCATFEPVTSQNHTCSVP